MARFRARPLEIEAVQFLQLGDHPAVKPVKDVVQPTFLVESMQGAVEVFPGDWIIVEPDGLRHYPCAPSVFAKKYEPIDN